MNTLIKSITTALVTLAVGAAIIASAQAQTPANKLTDRGLSNRPEFPLDLFRIPARRQNLLSPPASFSLMPARTGGINAVSITVGTVASPQVFGSGTLGKLTRWVGFTGSNSAIADSNIFEDKFGKIGIGTTTPTSLLTVQGMVEITLGGLKFPDGTVQTTSAGGALFSVAHDATLQGDGTAAVPLGVAIPLNLTGATGAEVLAVQNLGAGGTGVRAAGGNNDSGIAGDGVHAQGGSSPSGQAGQGLVARGGISSTGAGGRGVTALGGSGALGGAGLVAVAGASNGGAGGEGVVGFGGNSNNFDGGPGVTARGGNSNNSTGGRGVTAVGGLGSGVGNRGGPGVLASGGVGVNGATNGLAGSFAGDVDVTGNLSKGGGSFKIDHPLDPENKYLYHSFVESPDMMNIYNGNVTTDENGDAVIEMPDYFEALNQDFRYQLTVIRTFAQAIVADEITGNSFRIKTSAPRVKVSWQVTGVRHDAFANKNRIKVVVEKAEFERGYYLYPEAFDLPQQKSINWARNPGMMQQPMP